MADKPCSRSVVESGKSTEGLFEVSEIGETILSVFSNGAQGHDVAVFELNRIASPWVDSDR